jgi:hypothetical protein
VSLCPSIQHSPPRSARLLGQKRYLKPLLTVASALTCHRGDAHLQSIGDPLIDPVIGSILIGFEQDAGIKQLTRMSLTFATGSELPRVLSRKS